MPVPKARAFLIYSYMSYVINPFDLSEVTVSELLATGKIVQADGGSRPWNATLFPESMRSKTSGLAYDRDRIINYIDDGIYAEYGITILQKYEQMVDVNGGSGRLFVRSTQFGDYDNSVKRYAMLDKPVSYNKDNDIGAFLNLPKSLPPELTLTDATSFDPGTSFLPAARKSMEEKLFGQAFKHSHINTPRVAGTFKNNDKTTIRAVFDWVRGMGIKYIYSINERRPNVLSDNYVLNLVYYTVTGSK